MVAVGVLYMNAETRLVTVTIGGNDLGFASIVQDCFERYAARLGLDEAALCVFVQVDDESVLAALSGVEVVEGVKVTVVAIGWG